MALLFAVVALPLGSLAPLSGRDKTRILLNSDVPVVTVDHRQHRVKLLLDLHRVIVITSTRDLPRRRLGSPNQALVGRLPLLHVSRAHRVAHFLKRRHEIR